MNENIWSIISNRSGTTLSSTSQQPIIIRTTYEKGKIRKWREFWKKEEKQKEYTVDEFFNIIKNWYKKNDVETAIKHKENIVKLLKNAETLKQKTLMEDLQRRLMWMQKEVEMINKLGIKQYVYESDIIELERLGIDNRSVLREKLENYQKPIPQECSDKIQAALESGIFDRIVILYTRVKTKPAALDKTKQVEVPRKVDPICFGIIEWTGRMYPITDWMDDECDFTMRSIEHLSNEIVGSEEYL